MGLRVEQGIRRSSKRIMRLVPYESPAFKRGENVKSSRFTARSAATSRSLGRASAGGIRTRLRGVLVIAEIAFSLESNRAEQNREREPVRGW